MVTLRYSEFWYRTLLNVKDTKTCCSWIMQPRVICVLKSFSQTWKLYNCTCTDTIQITTVKNAKIKSILPAIKQTTAIKMWQDMAHFTHRELKKN